MNSHSRKKHKSTDNCENKSNDGGPEVFVLPPNLLEKLGIKLDNIVSNVTHPTGPKPSTDLTDKSIFLSKPDVGEDYIGSTNVFNKKNESSILETASLMKESVFLSPTFVPTVANVIPGEVEIARPYDQSEKCDDEIDKQGINTNCYPMKEIKKQNDMLCSNVVMIKDNIKTQSNCNSESIEFEDVGTDDNHIFSKNLTNSVGLRSATCANTNNNNHVVDKLEVKSNCSTLTSTTTEKSLNTNCRLEIPHEDVLTTKKKIEVLKEEALDLAKLYKRKTSNPNLNNNVLTPIAMHMVLPVTKKNNYALVSNEEKTNVLEKVDNEIKDITQTDILSGFVVNDVVEHVNVLCLENGAKYLNTFVNENVEMHEITNVEYGGEVGHNVVKIKGDMCTLDNKADNSHLNNKSISDKNRERVSHDLFSLKDDVQFNPETAFVEINSEPSNVTDIHDNHDVTMTNCELNDDSDSNLELHLHEEFIESCLKSPLQKRHGDLDILIETFDEKPKDGKEQDCLIDELAHGTALNSENVCTLEHSISRKNYELSTLSNCSKNEKDINESKKILRKSKLCIQGVEKPGGDLEDEDYVLNTKGDKVYKSPKFSLPKLNIMSNVTNQSLNDFPGTTVSATISQENLNKKTLKTYQRDKRNNDKIISCLDNFDVPPHTLFEAKKETTINLDAHENKSPEFCLCRDFGLLKYYDCDSSYEHIHFWRHEDVIVDRDLIFSIYNSDYLCDSDQIVNSLELSEGSEEPNGRICWNEICGDIDYDQVNSASNENQDKQKFNNQSESRSPQKSSGNESSNVPYTSNVIEKNMLEVTDETNTALKERNDVVSITCTEVIETHELTTEVIKESTEMCNSMGPPSTNKVVGSKAKKRKASVPSESSDLGEPHRKKDVKCGVCEQVLASTEWKRHSSEVHGLIAWKAGETLDFEDKILKRKVKKKLRKDGVLTCGFCKTSFNIAKRYMYHVQNCLKPKSNEKQVRRRRSSLNKDITSDMDSGNSVDCGVCQEKVKSSDWLLHISQKHNYLAWKSGESPLDLDDVDLIENHLCGIIKTHGPIICVRCGFERKYGPKRVKTYLAHIQTCNKPVDVPEKEEKVFEVKLEPKVEPELSQPVDKTMIRCGVCEVDVKDSKWYHHIEKEHSYMAWKQGETRINLDDDEEVRQHLYALTKELDGLTCQKCGIKRKYVKKYLSHIKICDGSNPMNISMDESQLSDISDTPQKHSMGERKIAKTYSKKDKLKESRTSIDGNAETEVAAPCNAEPPLEEKCNDTQDTLQSDQDVSMSEGSDIAKCAVCDNDVASSSWIDHIGKEHNYLAWKHGEKPLNLEDNGEVWNHLYEITKKNDGLICAKCGIKRKYVKKYLSHINTCDGSNSANEMSILNNLLDNSQISNTNDTSHTENDTELTKCGVCLGNVDSRVWLAHIRIHHSYIAWKHGDPPLDTNNEAMIEEHLNGLMKEHGHLLCSKCQLEHKSEDDSVKAYMEHMKSCDKVVDPDAVICGVCKEEVKKDLWLKHIEIKHQYIAWKDGEVPLELDDKESIRLYLFTILAKVEAFRCSKCGVQKKYPKSFITHLDACDAENSNPGNGKEDIATTSNETCVCAVCSESVLSRKWKEHAMNKHYNIAWKVGDFPIDLKSTYGTEKYLKEYKLRKGKLMCTKCGATRASSAGFYAHILTCGKTEEELEEYKNVCELCNNKYLCIYKNQHMAFHREQQYAKERKLKAKCKTEVEEEIVSDQPARRLAAIKANTVIEQINSTNEFSHTCPTCGYDADTEKRLARHKCGPATLFNEGNVESEESDDSIDSKDMNLSAEEELQDNLKRKKNKESMVPAKVPNVPFKYKELDSYIAQNAEDFYKVHFTNETLFPQWLSTEYEVLLNDQVKEYIPPMERSCNVQIDQEWITFDRFEAKVCFNGSCMFAGASVQCIAWAPPHVDEADGCNYLAVACHRDSDCPRYNYDELASHLGLIQIWDLGVFRKGSIPAFAMGIAHEYGTIWAMDWCPSGAREIRSDDDKKWARLGLLALACSDGIIRILSVPYPDTVAESGAFLKLKPVAMLKLTMGSDRRMHQATAINWCRQKEHTMVAVGYADGTTAFYDLNESSPLLQQKENGMTVFYPYHDDREHNVCVTDIDTAVVEVSRGCDGGVCSASLGGVAAVLRPAAARARLAVHSATTGCRFAPGWPTVMMAVEDALASQAPNELEWYGCARRLGPVRASCGCARCGRVLIHAPPMLRTLRATPPYADLRKQNILGIRAIPLIKKRERVNDELSMHVEPLKYEEAVAEYGLDIFIVDGNDKNNSINTVKEQWSERFPLADVTSMAFCPAERHHARAAVALHAGFILIVTV